MAEPHFLKSASLTDPLGVLSLWERASTQPPHRRDAALLHAAGLAPARSLGERNARLLELHAHWFGREIELLSHCPACGTAAQFTADSEALVARQAPALDAHGPHHLLALDHEVSFRLPDGDDVAAAAAEATNIDAVDDAVFARRLLARCVTSCASRGKPVSLCDLPQTVLEAISQRIEALDPGADISFALACPQCAAPWSASLHPGELLWPKLRAVAERLLLEVDALARAYGWTEPDVLALTPLRRAAYLQMATA